METSRRLSSSDRFSAPILKDLINVRAYKRNVSFSAFQKEALARTNRHSFISDRGTFSPGAGVRSRSFYLHVILRELTLFLNSKLQWIIKSAEC